jgi:hypothetical protein
MPRVVSGFARMTILRIFLFAMMCFLKNVVKNLFVNVAITRQYAQSKRADLDGLHKVHLGRGTHLAKQRLENWPRLFDQHL